ncbi:hypothetical protein GCM10023317_65290 [Actinopolymorpha pittospori]
MPQGEAFHYWDNVAAYYPRKSADPLGRDGVSFVRHRGRPDLSTRSRLSYLSDSTVLPETNLKGDRLADRREQR